MNELDVLFSPSLRETPFPNYHAYTAHLFACADLQLAEYIKAMMPLFSNGQGGFKNVLYPDIELAKDLCEKRLFDFVRPASSTAEPEPAIELPSDEELEALFSDFSTTAPVPVDAAPAMSVADRLAWIADRAAHTTEASLPLARLCEKLHLSPFTTFCLTVSILSATQTSYATVFQIVNQNSSLSAPTFESAAKVFFGEAFDIATAYPAMSEAVEQLSPILSLRIPPALPFSVPITPDKRLIDFFFGAHPERAEEQYDRFFLPLTDDAPLDPFLANQGILDALQVFYQDGGRILSLWGDEGAGRRFTIRHFCRNQSMRCLSVDCAKLFSYDFSFVQQAFWSATRECILTGGAICLTELGYREDEKEKFFGFLDLAFGMLEKYKIPVFAISKEPLPMKQIVRSDFALLELPTPNNAEREEIWRYYSAHYVLNADVDLEEMSVKFLFTPGKIKNALHQAKGLAAMQRFLDIPRSMLFQACYNQMSHELTQKATKIPAKFGWNDIVMNPDQRLALKNACDQLLFRKKVYEEWNYTKKYPYGRGLSVLLFGAPGTGKSMCAQVIAHELNLELYRVDLSKVVDKYVGETEKSISMIFREAKKCNVVLFFDECDTLFAKRADDGGANQSSNNNKTALLLQEVEGYDGVSVLATNYKHNIDPAFFRRMKFIVEFQFPDVDTREMLWNTTIPKSTPLAEDVDIRFLAERFEFVGGNIKNCILNAAFLAAADPEAEGEVHMKHYLQAIRYEFVKTGKVFTRADFEPYADLIL